MNLARQLQRTDPLRIFVESHVARRSGFPIPLVSTDFDVAIEAGLAIVTTTRVFKNAEEESIEATLTFPVPVHATLFDLRAKIGERSLVAKARRKDDARATYEDAIERGKSAVLHEEVLRGVHMLSIAHIPPGETIEVITTWAMTLTMIGAEGHLRIPLTVGDVYGRSPLSDADDLKTGGKPLIGMLKIKSPDAAVRLVNGFLENREARLQLNRPIDLVVGQWRPRGLTGTAADGRSISLLLEPALSSPTPLNVAILVDHSGSMNEPATAGPHPISKHGLVVAALRALSERLGSSDLVDLWEFDNTAKRIGSTGDDLHSFEWIVRSSAGRKLRALVNGLSAPNGGTEIGIAIATTIEQSPARDIVLITDGKSHALDIQALARKSRRISAVLIGEDSLEANIGHLAALTGGELFVSGGADIVDLFQAALDSTRVPAARDQKDGSQSGEKTFQRAGLTAKLSYGPTSEVSGKETSRAVAAIAANFLLPTLNSSEAADLAEREGIVSHLTSLVLVDEASVNQPGLPGQRKVSLPNPATAFHEEMWMPSSNVGVVEHSAYHGVQHEALQSRTSVLHLRPIDRLGSSNPPAASQDPITLNSWIAQQIDWGNQPSRLAAGDISQLSPDIQEWLKELAEQDVVKVVAQRHNITPLLLVIALIARVAGLAGSRSAARIAKAVLNNIGQDEIKELASLLHA